MWNDIILITKAQYRASFGQFSFLVFGCLGILLISRLPWNTNPYPDDLLWKMPVAIIGFGILFNSIVTLLKVWALRRARRR